jgi:hypothetical protein
MPIYIVLAYRPFSGWFEVHCSYYQTNAESYAYGFTRDTGLRTKVVVSKTII